MSFLLSPGQFSVRRIENYDISDTVVRPSGDMLVLERKVSRLAGLGIRIRRIALKSIGPGALVDGPSVECNHGRRQLVLVSAQPRLRKSPPLFHHPDIPA